MTDEDLVKNLAWYREEAGLEPAYPVTHPMSMFVRAIAARERLQREWVGLTDEDMAELDEDGVLFARYIETKLKEKNT
jgi:hypothetical protein